MSKRISLFKGTWLVWPRGPFLAMEELDWRVILDNPNVVDYVHTNFEMEPLKLLSADKEKKMGIRGLTTFISQNHKLSSPYELHDTIVLIDGKNFVHILYYANLDSIFGGDYYSFSFIIKNYIETLLKCNIRPIIIFDSGCGISDHKIKTVLERSNQRLARVKKICKTESIIKGRENLLPLCAYEVFHNTLLNLNIKFAQCDNQMTALANYYHCPVISNDSDYFILDIHCGIISFDSIEIQIQTKVNEDGNDYSFLNCKIYYIDKFVKYFPSIDRKALLLFGVLFGNNFIDEDEKKVIFKRLGFPKRQQNFTDVLKWLEEKGLNNGKKLILNCLEANERRHVTDYIECYQSPHSDLQTIIDDKDILNDFQLKNVIHRPCGTPVAIYITKYFYQGNLPPFFLYIISLKRVVLHSLVEDVSKSSSYGCSRYIRRVIYGILLRHRDSNSKLCRREECREIVEEYDRQNEEFQKEIVEPIFTLQKWGPLPTLDDVPLMNKVEARKLIAEVLEEEPENFDQVPEDWQLLFRAITYWLKNTKLLISLEFVFALIINILYFDLFITHDSSKDSLLEHLEESPSQDLSELEIETLRNRLTSNDVCFVSENIASFFNMRPTNPIDIRIIHTYNELQTTILYTVHLNKILEFPFINPSMQKIANGTMIYNLTKAFLSEDVPVNFVERMLGKEKIIYTLFIKIKDFLLKDVSIDYFNKETVESIPI